MTPSTVAQVMNNVALASQEGGNAVAQATVNSNGGDALIGVSASAWSRTSQNPISIAVWLDGQPTGSELGLTATAADMHLSLGHTWVWCQGLPAGQHELMLVAGNTTVTDANDFACATLWEMGTGCQVRFDEDEPSPEGTNKVLFKEAFETNGGTQILVSASCSGWATGAAGQVVGANIWYGAPTSSAEIYANNPGQDLAAVPSDFVYNEQHRGQQLVQLQALPTTSTSASDIAHLTVVELVDPGNAPVIRTQLQDQARSQHGDGGTVYSRAFTTGGGPLMARISSSAWTSGTNVPLQIGIQVDGTSRGFLQLFANPPTTHMAMVTNDLVLSGVPAGDHTLTLIGEINTITDQNDYVSITILEFPH